MQPQFLTKLQAGKSINADCHKGFCETVNWMEEVCKNIRGDDVTIRVDRSDSDVPVIKLDDNLFQMLRDARPTTLDEKSLNWTSDGVSAQAWNYEAPETADLVDIESLDDTEDYRFLVRPEDGGELQYASLSNILSALSSEISGGGGGGDCSCDLSTTLSSGTKIAAWTKDGQNWTDIYAPSASGGDCSCEMSAIHQRYDKDAQGQTQQYWENAKVGQFTDCNGDKTMLYAPNHVQFKGNAYPYWSNMGDQFELCSASDANVRISMDGTKITIGCYYI